MNKSATLAVTAQREASDRGMRNFRARFASRRAVAMLARNTVVSCMVFGLSIASLWLLVEFFGMNELVAATIGFLVANSAHYALGRAWIFRGTQRPVTSGYLYFLLSAGMGLAVTIILYAILLKYTPMNYLAARILVSLFAGLAMFLFNATVNFRRL